MILSLFSGMFLILICGEISYGRQDRRRRAEKGVSDLTLRKDDITRVHELGGENELFEGTLAGRRKRTATIRVLSSARSVAALAVKKLLTGAVEVPSKSRCCKDYEKFGNYREAVRDFNAVYPRDVYRFHSPTGAMAKSGELGDRTLLVRSYGKDGRPVLEIINRRTYMEKDPEEWLSSDPPIIRITYSKASNAE